MATGLQCLCDAGFTDKVGRARRIGSAKQLIVALGTEVIRSQQAFDLPAKCGIRTTRLQQLRTLRQWQ